MRRYQLPQAVGIARTLAGDSDAAVRVEAALALRDSQQICAALIDALRAGAAEDAHLRYEAAWHLGRNATGSTFEQLLADGDASWART